MNAHAMTEQFQKERDEAYDERDIARAERDLHKAALEKAQAFKVFVHKRLDDAGVPADPEPAENAKHGCRIEGRLNWLLGLANVETQRADLAEEELAEARAERDLHKAALEKAQAEREAANGKLIKQGLDHRLEESQHITWMSIALTERQKLAAEAAMLRAIVDEWYRVGVVKGLDGDEDRAATDDLDNRSVAALAKPSEPEDNPWTVVQQRRDGESLDRYNIVRFMPGEVRHPKGYGPFEHFPAPGNGFTKTEAEEQVARLNAKPSEPCATCGGRRGDFWSVAKLRCPDCGGSGVRR
jgi:hypothetical protein